jgi:hypothetical protein
VNNWRKRKHDGNRPRVATTNRENDGGDTEDKNNHVNGERHPKTAVRFGTTGSWDVTEREGYPKKRTCSISQVSA